MRRGQLERAIVFYDGSESAGAGLAFALGLARSGQTTLTVAHVITPEAGEIDGLPSTRADAIRWLDQAAKRIGGAEAASFETLVIERDHPADAIVSLSAEPGVDLVIAGKTGQGGLRRYVLGTSAERLLEHSPSSVAVFPKHSPPDPPKRVVVGYDGSVAARVALSQGAGVAGALSLPLTVVHAVNDQLPYPMNVGPQATYTESMRRHGTELLVQALGRLGDDSSTAVELLDGDPRKALLELSAGRPPALIVLGYRGAGGFVGLRFGSTAWALARNSRGPVLIAKASPETEHQ